MPRKPRPKRSLLDTRGIPKDMDPHVFYMYKANLVAAQAIGVEWLIYRLFGPANVTSMVFAIDPFASTKLSKVKISAVNRLRYVVKKSVLDDIYRASDVKSHGVHIDKRTGATNDTDSGTTSRTQLSVLGASSSVYINDTSASTRVEGSDFGEAEFHFVDLIAPPWSLFYNLRNVSDTSIIHSEVNSSTRHAFNRFVSLSSTAHKTMRDVNLGVARAELLNQQHNLVRQALPTSRRFAAGRSVAELKDVPRSIATMRLSLSRLLDVYKSLDGKSIRDKVFSLRNVTAQIPSEYLSFHFGWKQLYGDVMKMLSEPEKVSKAVDRLIERNGKLSTYTSSMKYSRGRTQNWSGFFTTGTSSLLESPKKAVRLEDNFNLHCTLQAKFDFPPTLEILFREDLFVRKLGIIPTPVDLYNLVPWSWLIDWFSGLGQYLHLIEEINSDPQLINFGFVSVNMGTTIDVVCDAKQLVSQDIISQNGSTISNVITKNPVTYGAQCNTRTYVRKDISNLASLRNASTGVNLTSFQQSIIGALLAQKAKH